MPLASGMYANMWRRVALAFVVLSLAWANQIAQSSQKISLFSLLPPFLPGPFAPSPCTMQTKRKYRYLPHRNFTSSLSNAATQIAAFRMFPSRAFVISPTRHTHILT